MKIRAQKSQRGIALVLTLAVLAVLSLIVIGFLVSMRTEQNAARNAVSVTVARQMAQAGVDNAVFRMRANMPLLSSTNSFVTMAGAAVPWPSASSVGGQLYSVSTGGTNDLNADQVIVSSNALYSTSTSRQILANWINVATDGSDGSGGSPLIGRYAFWVDDEASKFNINSANQRSTADIMGTQPSAVDLTVLNDSIPANSIGPATATNSWQYAQTNGYFTAEQWQMASNVGITKYQLYQFYITPFSTDTDQTPWGTQKFNLNKDFNSWKNEIEGGLTNTLAHPALANWFGNTFFNKYAGTLQQIGANICDYRYAPTTAATWMGADFLDGGLAGTWGVPTKYLGLRRFPFLNEIGVQATFWRPAGEIQCKLWFLIELVNPYDQPCGNGAEIRINMDKLVYHVTNSLAGAYYCGFESGWAANAGCLAAPYPNPVLPTGEFTYTLTADVAANSYAVYPVGVYAGNADAEPTAGIDQVYVRVNKVRLLGQASTDNTIRDWATIADFDTRLRGGNHFTFTNNIQSVASGVFSGVYDDTKTAGIAKNDPRVRRFVNFMPPGTGNQLPWSPVGFDTNNPTTLPSAAGAQNSVVDMQSGTGINNISNDPMPTGPGVATATNVVTSPSFQLKCSTTDIPYASIGELGYIHSGLQWRTLMLQPCPSNEISANFPADWAVLDIFSVTNVPLQGRININGIITNLASATTPLRITPLQGVLTAITTANNLGFATDQGQIASNIYNQAWAASSRWSMSRTNLPRKFKSGVFNMIGELCEIDAVCTNWSPSTVYTNDAMREARIRSFANLVTTRSDTFTVWGMGQAIQDINNNGAFDSGDLITAETKVQAVVQRYEEGGQVKFRTLYFRYLTP